MVRQSKIKSSRENLISAIACQSPGVVPCCFMIFSALKNGCRDEFEFAERQLSLGLDTRISVPELPVNFHQDVKINEWKENRGASAPPLLHKEYETPKGKLRSTIQQTGDWPYGDHVPLFDDYITPRATRYLIREPADLPAFRYLLNAPSKDEISRFREDAKRYKQFAEEHELLLCGGWFSGFRHDKVNPIGADYGNMGIDALMWLCGAVHPLYWAHDNPGFLEELIQIIADWNYHRMEVQLESGVDLMVKRAWYESTDFWSPHLYRRFISPVLKREIDLTHQAGAKFGYIMTSGMMPLLDELLSLDIDVLIGIDPLQGRGVDLRKLAEKVGGKICLWGGVNGFITIEQGTAEEVRGEVENAKSILGKTGGFILSPVDNVTDESDLTWENVKILIDEWKKE